MRPPPKGRAVSFNGVIEKSGSSCVKPLWNDREHMLDRLLEIVRPAGCGVIH